MLKRLQEDQTTFLISMQLPTSSTTQSLNQWNLINVYNIITFFSWRADWVSHALSFSELVVIINEFAGIFAKPVCTIDISLEPE